MTFHRTQPGPITRKKVRTLVLTFSLAASAAALQPAFALAASPIATAENSESSTTGDASSELLTAIERAKSTGKPVEVMSETTETTQVMAQPNGSLALTSNARPVRVERNGEWRPVDTTLRRNADGSVSPIAAAVDVEFSGGGAAPLLRLADDDSAVELSWPTELPEPTLRGDTATYANVLPDVDLQMIAYAEGYRQVLVVHNAAAAANPALREIRMVTKATGVTLDEATDGTLTAVDDEGDERFSGVLPTMWDSSSDGPTGSEGTAHSANSRVHEVPMTVAKADGRDGTAAGELAIAPPQRVLDSSDLEYPIFIDPSMSTNRKAALPYSNYLTVHSGGWDYFNNEGEPMRVGHCGWSGCTSVQGTARSYFSFNLSAIRGTATPHIVAATVNVWQSHMAAACGQTVPTTLHAADAFSAETNWGGPRWRALQTVVAKFDAECAVGAGAVSFGNAEVISHVQSAMNIGQAAVRFNLSAPNESDPLQWKKFGNNPSIVVIYDAPASVVPGSLSLDSIACPGKPRYAVNASPLIFATGVDNNPVPGKITFRYEVHNNPSSGSPVRAIDTVAWPSGAPLGWGVTPALPDGNYALRVAAYSTEYELTAGWSAWYYFTVDKTVPAVPTITTSDYPPGYWGAPQNAPGTFTISGPADTAAFSYSFDTASVPAPTNTMCSYNSTSASGGMTPAAGGKATITPPTTLTPGYHTLRVHAFDDAHNLSATTASYQFYVSPAFAGTGQTKFEAESITPTQPFGQGDPAFNEGNGYPVFRASAPAGAEASTLVATAGDETNPARFSYAFNTNLDAYYALSVRVVSGVHNGILAFEIDGRPVLANGRETFDSWSFGATTRVATLGGLRLAPGTHTLTVKVVGANPFSQNYLYNGTYGGVTINGVYDHGRSAASDSFTVVPINNVNYASFESALNNNGVVADGSPGTGDLELTDADKALSLEAMTAAGFGPGTTVTANGVTFKMPAHAAGGNDNVMAMGQTIAMTKDANGQFPLANAVDLLVTSTCGPTPVGAHVQVTMDHEDSSNPEVPIRLDTQIAKVPDWLSGETSTSLTVGEDRVVTVNRVATLPRLVAKSGVDSTQKPALYHLKVPVVAGAEGMRIKAITLPGVGSDFMERSTCQSPILHVFSISTS